MKTDYIVVLTTYPTKELAQEVSESLVKKKLAACINIVSNVTSVYYWGDKLESDTECQLIIKTKRDLFERISQEISAHHPYDLPEIIAIKLENGLPDYLRWIDQQTQRFSGSENEQD